MRLKDKVAIITGGARGIGYAIAKRYVDEGAKVALWDVLEEELGQARQKLSDLGGEVKTYVVNVTSADSVRKAFEDVEKDLGKVDIMVNNAGITRDSMLHKMSDDQWNKVIDVNLKGVFLCGREAATRMRDRREGVIINTSSVVGLYGNVGQTNYAATKAGVIGMTQSWAKELGRKGVRVNAVAPGYTMTEMMETVPEKILDGLRSKTPLQRLGAPEDVAAAFAFLASDDAAFITGHVLSVDGGLTL
jgi:3-oxoacyl-[acyl-carrier protein] reductase